ncbi:DUF2505 domain-containing protein [Gordonia sp. TBRC 11910]|uniref:DUF2505 domain-containing protein n=1 Tax=Gordonia asplenii TaxID=2725283 RepID=A0A848KR95_9ACTN|nr:DUF2505 domain-containing protein [Gordonia asplenii]NMO00772.1 DUF2505 domain-containing protein [Gordonia asplenii]
MASTLQHSVTYAFPTERLWTVVSTEQYWHDLLEAIGHGGLDSFAFDGDTVTVTMTQTVPEDKLPSMVTKIRPGDLHIPRKSVLRRQGETIVGELTATVDGAPAKVDGSQNSSGAPESTTRYTGTVTVAIPFVGGKVEKAILDQLIVLLDAEHEHTVEWEQAHR